MIRGKLAFLYTNEQSYLKSDFFRPKSHFSLALLSLAKAPQTPHFSTSSNASKPQINFSRLFAQYVATNTTPIVTQNSYFFSQKSTFHLRNSCFVTWAVGAETLAQFLVRQIPLRRVSVERNRARVSVKMYNFLSFAVGVCYISHQTKYNSENHSIELFARYRPEDSQKQ